MGSHCESVTLTAVPHLCKSLTIPLSFEMSQSGSIPFVPFNAIMASGGFTSRASQVSPQAPFCFVLFGFVLFGCLHFQKVLWQRLINTDPLSRSAVIKEWTCNTTHTDLSGCRCRRGGVAPPPPPPSSCELVLNGHH